MSQLTTRDGTRIICTDWGGGLPIEDFDAIRKGTFDSRSQFFRDLTLPFCGYDHAGAAISEGVRDAFWFQGMMGGDHGLPTTHQDEVNADLLAFVRGETVQDAAAARSMVDA